jgi:hypothetical protein
MSSRPEPFRNQKIRGHRADLRRPPCKTKRVHKFCSHIKFYLKEEQQWGWGYEGNFIITNGTEFATTTTD